MNDAENPSASTGAFESEYPANPAEVTSRPTLTGAGPRVAGASTLIDPAEAVFEQQDSNRSICESDSGTSIRSSSGMPRVSKVSKRP